jgi:hypothetical protein
MTSKRQQTAIPPYFIVWMISTFRAWLLKLNKRMFPGSMVLYEHFQNLWLLPSIYVAAELNVAELLRQGPLPVAGIAVKTGADEAALYRVLRALASQGIFRQYPGGRFGLNAMSRALLNDRGSLRHMLIQHLGKMNWQALGDLLYTVQTGKEAFPHVHGTDMYTFLKNHPAEFELFDRSMSNLSDLALAPLLKAYPFTGYNIVADIGGGEGFFLSGILERNPEAVGILFDLPEAMVKVPGEGGTRITRVTGNFLEAVPVAADVYILKNILHNWNDENSALILSNIKKSMPRGAHIAVIEMIVPGDDRPSVSKLLDIQMMASFRDGKERTLPEYHQIASRAGLRIRRVVPSVAPVSVIEMVGE